MLTRHRIPALRFALFALALMLVSAASHAGTVGLRWTGAVSSGPVTGLGTNAITVSNTEVATLTLDLVIGIGPAETLSAYGIDFEFDRDGADELDIVSFSELSWENAKATRTLSPADVGILLTQESELGGPEGQLFGFEALTLSTGPSNLTLTMARMVFATNPARVREDGSDVFSSHEGNACQDCAPFAFNSNTNATIPFQPFGASVNAIPEPTSAALLGLGLGAFALAVRKR